MNPYADRVRLERLRREWSVRQAASAGGISNTYWGEFEDYKRQITPMIAAAVAQAYGWSEDWPDQPAANGGADLRPASQAELIQLRGEVGSVARRVQQLAQVVGAELGLDLASLLDDEESSATPDGTGPDGVARPSP